MRTVEYHSKLTVALKLVKSRLITMFRHSIATMLVARPLRRRTSTSALASWYCTLQVNIIPAGTETIKPSSPTPAHLTKFNLSLLDNYMPSYYSPFVFFYPCAPESSSSGGAERLDILKSSLAHALTRFYPLAGRLSKSSIPIVHCNDEGVPFSSAALVVEDDDVSDDDDSWTTMTRFLSRRPQIESLRQFLPFPAFLIDTPSGMDSGPQMAVRATVFPCGGLAIGFCFLHKIVDGNTLVDFLKHWAAIARGNNNGQVDGGGVCVRDRDATSLFPARPDDVAVDYSSYDRKKSATRRFVFNEEAITALKARARSERVPNPSRSEAIFGLLWKSAINAGATASAPDRLKTAGSVHSVAGMAVNLRSRMKELTMAGLSIGNLVWVSTMLYENYAQAHYSDETKTFQQLVCKLRSSVDGEFMEKLKGGGGREEFLRNEETRWKMLASATNRGDKVTPFTMTSVVGMGLYGVDFGWGKPSWISMTTILDQIGNSALLMDSPVGYGAEAWVFMYEQEMAIFERDPDILAYAKNNPNVL